MPCSEKANRLIYISFKMEEVEINKKTIRASIIKMVWV